MVAADFLDAKLPQTFTLYKIQYLQSTIKCHKTRGASKLRTWQYFPMVNWNQTLYFTLKFSVVILKVCMMVYSKVKVPYT